MLRQQQLQKDDTLSAMLSSKRALFQLVLLAIVVSFSIGVLSNVAAAQTVVPSAFLIVGGVLVTVLAIATLAADLRFSLSFEDRLNGVIFVDPASNELVDVEGYELAGDLTKTLAAIKAESKAIYSEWESDPLVKKKQAPPEGQEGQTQGDSRPRYIAIHRRSMNLAEKTRPKASLLLDEALQFVVLEELSTHLSTYFRDDASGQIVEMERSDIPAFLLQNRVLNLLTTPIEQRDIFLSAFPRDKPDGILYMLWGSDGAVYSRFDLMLPKDSKVTYVERGALRIQTKRVDLEIRCRYTGFSAVAGTPPLS
jgi:hypothetical protein